MSRLPPAQIPRPAMSPVLGVAGPGVGELPRVEFTWGNLPGKPTAFPPAAHNHSISEVTGLQLALEGKQPVGDYITSATHNVLATVVSGKLNTTDFTWAALPGKPSVFAPAAHSHPISEITGLDAALAGKQPVGSYSLTSHTHDYLPLTGGTVVGRVSFVDQTVVHRGVGGAGGLTAFYSFQDAAGVERGWVGFGRGTGAMDLYNGMGPVLINGVDVVASLGNKAAIDHTHPYLPLTGGQITGNLGVGIYAPDSTFQVASPTGAGFRIGYAGAATNFMDGDAQVFRLLSGANLLTLYAGQVTVHQDLYASTGNIFVRGNPYLGGTGLRLHHSGTHAYFDYDGSMHFRDGNGSPNMTLDVSFLDLHGKSLKAGSLYAYNGALYLNSDATRFLYWDGSKYHLPGGDLSINGVDVLTTLNTKFDKTGGTINGGLRVITGAVAHQGTGSASALSCYYSFQDSSQIERGWVGFGRGNNTMDVMNSAGPVLINGVDVVSSLNTKAVLGHTHSFGSLTGVTVSTASPSGGADGDIWLKVPA